MQACVTYQIYTIRSFTSAYCTLCIHTTSVTSHRMSMGAVLTYAAVWWLVHSQWISSSIGSVIKVSIRPLQLWNRTLHAEHGRRSSAIGTIIQVCFAVTQMFYFFQNNDCEHLTFEDHWGFGCCGTRVCKFDAAGEVGLAVGQVFKQQATDVAREDAGPGFLLEGGMLLLVRVRGVKESLPVWVLAIRCWWLSGNRIFAIHPEVVLIYWAVVQLNHLLGWRKAFVEFKTQRKTHSG